MTKFFLPSGNMLFSGFEYFKDPKFFVFHRTSKNATSTKQFDHIE